MKTSAQDGHDREPGDVDDGRTLDEQLKRCGHRAEIGAEIDRVGDHEQTDKRVKERDAGNADGCFRPGLVLSPCRSER